MSEYLHEWPFGSVQKRVVPSNPSIMEDREKNAQLDLLRDKILLLGGKTEDAVHRAMRSLTERNSDLARGVCVDDEQIDQMELEIDSEDKAEIYIKNIYNKPLSLSLFL